MPPSPPSLLARWLQRSFTILLATALPLLWISASPEIDFFFADLYYDAGTQRFPWKDRWFSTKLMHSGARTLLISVGLVLIVFVTYDLNWPQRWLSPLRRTQLRIVALSAALAPLLIGVLKANSALHCPNKIERYGGAQPYLEIFAATPDVWEAGSCFPAGHASAGMWLAALAVFWLPRAPARANAIFLCGLLVGSGLGWVQQMRGQHFLSHTLWTLWLTSALILALLALFATALERHHAPTANRDGSTLRRPSLSAWRRAAGAACRRRPFP